MARPEKPGIKYFNIDCDDEDKIELLIAKYKMEGYGILVRLWRKCYKTEGYYSEWNEDSKLLFCRDNGVDLDKLDAIVEFCFEKKIFNREMFNKYGIITSSGVQKRWLSVVISAKRKNTEIDEKYCLLELTPDETQLTPEETPQNSALSTQRKEKKSKGSKLKEVKGEREFFAPSQLDVFSFFLSKKVETNWPDFLCEHEAQKFINHYTSNGWMVGKSPMANWQNAASGWITKFNEFNDGKSKNTNTRNAVNGRSNQIDGRSDFGKL